MPLGWRKMALEPAPAGGGMDTASAQGGFYCSTSGSHIATKEALLDHYKSELHRYNLKRKASVRCDAVCDTAIRVGWAVAGRAREGTQCC